MLIVHKIDGYKCLTLAFPQISCFMFRNNEKEHSAAKVFHSGKEPPTVRTMETTGEQETDGTFSEAGLIIVDVSRYLTEIKPNVFSISCLNSV